MDIPELLAQGLEDNAFKLRLKRPGVYQVIAPIFHDDGDMVSIYIETTEDNRLLISDHGMSLMRLSYLFDMDSENKVKTLNNIVLAKGAEIIDGSIDLKVMPNTIIPSILSYAQLVAEIGSMEILSRELISNLFYEQLRATLDSMTKLGSYIANFTPKGFPDVVADYAYLPEKNRPILLFGVKDTNKAQQAALCCYQLTLNHYLHKSIAVFEDVDNVSRVARKFLLNAAGKVYSDLSGFQQGGEDYILGEFNVA